MNILVVMQVEEEHKKILSDATNDGNVKYIPNKDLTEQDVTDADIIIGNISPGFLRACKNLKLLQLNSAGTDGYTTEGVLPQGAVLANASGAYGLAISEHMIGALLFMMKKLDIYRLEQEKHNWVDHGNVTSIYGSKTLVVGLGDIGSEFAVRMNALGSKVYGIRRNKAIKPDYLEGIYTLEDLPELLPKMDIVAASLPKTAETHKLFDEETFGMMKKGSFFMNVGRGDCVDSDALYDSLCSGHLKGASLDVTDPEPLPPDHKLWTAPGVFITPHISGKFHLRATHDKIIEIAAKNIIHLAKGESFENLVDMGTGYKKSVY